ncbi:MAG TPA: SUF system NifU family Fe-S cluster assembly protein [Actinomycetota bacterium]|jgi:nitrogen fixation NifU-like protein
MSSLDELYKEVILDHYRSPRNRGKLEPSDFDLHRDNPLCGDEIHVYAQVEDGRITGISFEGKGCSISQASVSMMTEKIKGLATEDAEGLANQFKSMMQGENPQDPERLGDLVALQGVQKYPVRIKCALLGWNTFLEGLKVYRDKQGE